ncbi:hypothetical protein Btru_002377 [Bulinus truncatus]|nr:hypothetical protein Btru_002377 [Bulinus truncatus]
MNLSAISGQESRDTFQDTRVVVTPEARDMPNNVTYGWDSEDSSIYAVALVINEYYLWPIFAIGFPGNLASIFTIFRMRNLGSFTLYVVLLAIMDNCALLVKLTMYQLFKGQVNIGTYGCRGFLFLGTFSTTYANWLLVLMATERLIAVRYPLKIQKYLGYRKSIIWISVVGVFLFGVFCPILWVYTYEGGACTIYSEYMGLMQFLRWVNPSLSAFIPFILLALINVLIMRVIRQSFRLRNTLRNLKANNPLGRRSSCHDVSTQRQIMLMLFTSAFVFVVFVFPLCALSIASVYVDVQHGTIEYDVMYLCTQIAYLLFDSTHAINFYLYFLSARKFRNHFLRLALCKNEREKSTNL